jgi:hypothetical protein
LVEGNGQAPEVNFHLLQMALKAIKKAALNLGKAEKLPFLMV